MRHYKEYTKEITERELVKVTCDRCEAVIPKPEKAFETRRFHLEFTTGDSYPGTGHEQGWSVEDLCDDCVKWIKEILVSDNVKLTDVRRNWS